MDTKLDASSEFALLVNQLHNSPNNPALKQEVVRRLPEMKILAKTKPLDLYRLAQIYSQNSIQYQKMMTQSADLGCTNAMLAVVKMHLSATPSDLKKAAIYALKIERSNDSFIQKHAKALLEDNPKLKIELNTLKKSLNSSSSAQFFSTVTDTEAKKQNNSLQIKASMH